MRKLTYFIVNIPSLKRTILFYAGDEEGNATSYVFDNNVLNTKSISSEDLELLTKDELNNLLEKI